jgi:hypothetical protein
MFGKGREPGWREVYLTVTENDDTENLRLGTFIKEKTGWDKNSKDKLRAIIEIAPNVIVYSDEPFIPALSINAEDFRSYDQLFVIVKENARIYGAAGAPGVGGGIVTFVDKKPQLQINGADGGRGGTAVFASRPVRLVNHGKIYGGGGGGGGGGGHQTTSSSGGSSSTRCEGKTGGGGGQHCCPVIETITKEVCKNKK